MKLSKSDFAYFDRVSVMLITGGSSGIGCSIIKAILKLRPNLWICNLSRSKPTFFLGENGHHFSVDLTNAHALAETAEVVIKHLGEAPPGQWLLVNNSGFGDYGRQPNLDRQKQLSMIDLNIRAVVDLTQRLLPSLETHGGVVVNVASTAAFQPTPFLATYGATKAFVRNWSLALNEDLRGSGVRTLALCPGPTQSNFFKSAGFNSPPMAQGRAGALDMTADELATRTLRAIARGRSLIVTGWKNRLISFFGGQLPLTTVTRVGAIILRKLRLEQHR